MRRMKRIWWSLLLVQAHDPQIAFGGKHQGIVVQTGIPEVTRIRDCRDADRTKQNRQNYLHRHFPLLLTLPI